MQLITGKTKLLGIIGEPIEHSFSPVMHNAALAHLHKDYVYLPFPVKLTDLSQAIKGFAAIDLVGFNVTIPHKQNIIPYLDVISPEASMIGAVNTVWRSQQGWQGTNTDVYGFIFPLQQLERNWQNITPVVLGNGGAARAVVGGLLSLGCEKIYIIGRDINKLEKFKNSWQTAVKTALLVRHWENLEEIIANTELLINTTPVGMYPQIDASPISANLIKKLQPGAIAYDLIYTPNPTKFLQAAQRQGAVVIDGLEMLVQQGAKSLEIWLNQPAPLEIMRKSLKDHLGL